jgi:hypothetical protein
MLIPFLQKERDCQVKIIEQASHLDMTAPDFRQACVGMIMRGEATPGHLIKQGYA